MSDAPDRETSSDDEASTIGEECVLCSEYDMDDVVLYPCDCAYGIVKAHRSCFQDYCNSWPINHPNRTICPFCKVPYRGIIGLIERDQSWQRGDVYILSTYMIAHSVGYSLLYWTTETFYHVPFLAGFHAWYTTLIYFIFDFLLTMIGVSRLGKKMKLNGCMHLVAFTTVLGLVLFQQPMVLFLYTVFLHVTMMRRLAWRRMEFHHIAQ